METSASSISITVLSASGSAFETFASSSAASEDEDLAVETDVGLVVLRPAAVAAIWSVI